jgi:acyl-CoA synthetase (AMP-forming)/AMP-acid ligase II
MLIDVGIRPGDRIGIMAGNCEQYVAAVFATARVGAILVVLNNTYTAAEALRALRHTGISFAILSNGRLLTSKQPANFFSPPSKLGR